MCENWRHAKIEDCANVQGLAFQKWWTEGCVVQENIKAMKRWFNWWKIRIAHWGSLNKVIKSIYKMLLIYL